MKNQDQTQMKNQNQMQTGPSRATIAMRAYRLWEMAGCPSGRDMEYWLQAEAELTAASQHGTRRLVASGAGSKPGLGLSVASQTKIPARQVARPENRILAF
jgi:hypothetical protein